MKVPWRLLLLEASEFVIEDTCWLYQVHVTQHINMAEPDAMLKWAFSIKEPIPSGYITRSLTP